ncbi:MAG: hypothetical protein ACHQEB_05325 [Chitinophagales bacterium]
MTLAYTVAGQQLPQGTFILSTGFTYQEFTFKNKFRFNYKYSSCTGGQEGSGTYTFKNKELILTFDNPKKKPLPLQPLLLRQETQNDTSYLSFKFFDQKDTTPIAGVIIKFLNKSNGKTYGTRSNELGQARLKIKNDEFPLDFEINYIGIDPQTIKLDTSGNYSIVFPLNFEFMKPLIKGDTLSFIIDEFDDDELILKPPKEKEFRTFTRKED